MLKDHIVVTGMGAVTPLGIGVATYWKNLIASQSGISFISRFDTNKLTVKVAAEVKDYTPADFLPKKITKSTDIFMQFALIAAEEALADSNININPERIGIVLGTALGGISTVTGTQQQITESGSYRISPFTVPKILGNIAASQLAIIHNIQGPCLTVNTACASGSDAVGMASILLKSREVDAVVAVGAESILTELMAAGLSTINALSTESVCPDSASRPFDLLRNGFVMGEGGGAIVLERLDSAKERGAEIKAELLGYASNMDAYHITSPEPTGHGQVLCMQKAIREAGINSSQIDYINAHGTSTPIGDRIETAAIKAVFGTEGAKKIPISSTKGATAHLMGAGGITEVIACIKSIHDGLIPPTLNYENPDIECDLDYVPKKARKADVKIAMSNAFGFGGQNSSLVVGQYKE